MNECSCTQHFHSNHYYATYYTECHYKDHVARSFIHGQALVKLHQHAGEYDVVDNRIGD